MHTIYEVFLFFLLIDVRDDQLKKKQSFWSHGVRIQVIRFLYFDLQSPKIVYFLKEKSLFHDYFSPRESVAYWITKRRGYKTWTAIAVIANWNKGNLKKRVPLTSGVFTTLEFYRFPISWLNGLLGFTLGPWRGRQCRRRGKRFDVVTKTHTYEAVG